MATRVTHTHKLTHKRTRARFGLFHCTRTHTRTRAHTHTAEKGKASGEFGLHTNDAYSFVSLPDAHTVLA